MSTPSSRAQRSDPPLDCHGPTGLAMTNMWRGDQLAPSTPGMSSGFRALDRELPGNGWPRSTLIELLVRDLGIGELRFLAPTLRTLTQSGKHVVLLAPPHIPYAPAFQAMGIDHRKILLVQAKRPVDRLWAVEQSLKSDQFGALFTWLDTEEHDRLVRPELIRRLQLAASRTQGLVFAFRPFAAQEHASPAPLRILLLPRRYPEIAAQIIKRRGPFMSSPIDIAIPIPGTGLRPIPDHEAIVAGTPHAVDRMSHSRTLPATLLPAAATHGSPARR